MEYCQTGVLEKYAEVAGDTASAYFDQPRIWQLSVYDHAGAATRFRYRLAPGGAASPDEGGAAPAWTTEIPAAKLYAALELGESLTSMYMRINDTVFDADTERELAEADVVDDPLIRCLFSDGFGAYQAAQLRRLLAR